MPTPTKIAVPTLVSAMSDGGRDVTRRPPLMKKSASAPVDAGGDQPGLPLQRLFARRRRNLPHGGEHAALEIRREGHGGVLQSGERLAAQAATAGGSGMGSSSLTASRKLRYARWAYIRTLGTVIPQSGRRLLVRQPLQLHQLEHLLLQLGEPPEGAHQQRAGLPRPEQLLAARHHRRQHGARSSFSSVISAAGSRPAFFPVSITRLRAMANAQLRTSEPGTNRPRALCMFSKVCWTMSSTRELSRTLRRT